MWHAVGTVDKWSLDLVRYAAIMAASWLVAVPLAGPFAWMAATGPGRALATIGKGGLVAFSKTLAREHARHGITVNVVCPGPTDTALLAGVTDAAPNPEKLREAFTKAIPLGRLGQPQDLAAAIAFFASDDAGFITGQVLSVSGGLTMNG